MKVSKLLAVVVIILVVALVIGGLWYLFRPSILITDSNNLTKTNIPEETITPQVQATPTPGVTDKPAVSDSDLIKTAMAIKHSKEVSEVNLTVKGIEGNYANGGVTFAGEISGGWWLAAKTGGEWVIVADGNGTVMCASLSGYSFPLSMVPECWDEDIQKLIKL